MAHNHQRLPVDNRDSGITCVVEGEFSRSFWAAVFPHAFVRQGVFSSMAPYEPPCLDRYPNGTRQPDNVEPAPARDSLRIEPEIKEPAEPTEAMKVVEASNGARRIFYPDGTIVRTSPDGYSTTELPDGTRVSRIEGNETTEFPGGLKVIEVNGHIDLVLSNGTRIFHDGQVWVPRAEGGFEITYPGGEKSRPTRLPS